MGQFIFNGKSSIFSDLALQLPLGKSYMKEANIIPYTNNTAYNSEGYLRYIENFTSGEYPEGTNVQIFINDQIYKTVQIHSQSIYCVMNPPGQGNFKFKTVINGKIYRQEQYIATNIFLYFMVLAQTYTPDYNRVYSIFSNLYDKYLLDAQLYPKIGWFYDFGMPTNWETQDYRSILTGYDSNGNKNNASMNEMFLNAMTVWCIKELCIAFTGVAPTIESARDENGWIMIDDTLLSSGNIYYPYDSYWLTDGITGSRDISGLNLNGLTLNLLIYGIPANITFTSTRSPTDILNQINNSLSAITGIGNNVTASIKTYTYNYISGTTLSQHLHFNNNLNTSDGTFFENDFIVTDGTALIQLGLETGEWGIVNGINEIIELDDEQYYNNNITLTINKGIHEIQEEQITKRYTPNPITYPIKDLISHKYVLDTVGHPFPATITDSNNINTYVKGTDYNLYTDTITNNCYVNWISSNIPLQNATYQITYYYYIKDEITQLVEMLKPATLKITYIFDEN